MGTSLFKNSQVQDSGANDSTPIDEVATLAYEKFVARGRLDGYDVEDWTAAEKELKNNRETKHKANNGFDRESARPVNA